MAERDIMASITANPIGQTRIFTSGCLWRDSCLIYVICVLLPIVVSNTYCVVFSFVFFVFVLCTPFCQFLWNIYFYCPFGIV